SDLRALLTTTNEESDAEEGNVNDTGGAIPAAVDAQLAYATARLAVHQGQLERAERTLRQAQAHWGRANDQRGATRTLLGLTQVLAMQGRYDEAEAAARQAVAVFAASPTAETFSAEGQTGPVDRSAFSGSLLRAGAHHNLATLLLYTERHTAALAEYDRALQLLSTYNDATLTAEAQRSWLLEVAHNELNRAGALSFLDRPEEAEAALLRAAGAFTQAEDRTNHGRVQTNLGRLYLRGGHYAAALAAFDRAVRDLLDDEVAELLVTTPAVDLAAEGRSGEEAATPADALLRQADELLLEQATAYLVMNLLPEAEQRLTHCEVLFRTAAQPYELGQTLYTRGILRLRTADFADAAHNLAEAAGQFAQLNNHFWRNRTALAQAALHFATGDASSAAEALDALIAALPAQEANGEGAALQWDLGGLLDLYLLRLRVAVVSESLAGAAQWAEEIADLLDLSLPALQAQAAAVDSSTATEQSAAEEAVALPHYTQRFYHLLGQWARARGAPLEARYYFQRAIALLERTRALLPVEEIRTAFLDDKGELYADLILLLLEQADADPTAVADAFAAVERARSRAL
ncbi:MAG: tetratricopeptide repeat protein, partial [Caldilineaceae bacterium]|nr:tetratricopeptide repeat protein [Caldilineaceae bacterium]